MKILDFALITDENKNPAMRQAIALLGDEIKVIDWVKIYTDYGVDFLNQFFLQTVKEFLPDLIFMQIQLENVVYIDTIKKIKEKNIYIINWTGDVRQPTPQWYKDMGALIDLTLFTNITDIDELKKCGIKADYLQVGFENSIFTPIGAKGNYPEIVFLGSNYVDAFPFSQERIDMVKMLDNHYKEKFKVYGKNWETEYLQNEDEACCYRSCKIAINQNHYRLPRFSSDRLLRIMGSGAFCLSYHYDDIGKEFKIGKHLDVWSDFDELINKIDYYLKSEIERKLIAKCGCELVHGNYTWQKRMSELKKIIKK